MRIAIYARYSTDLQSDASIEDQIRLCKERTAKEGWSVVQTYSDRGISGASLMRPGIQGLLEGATKNKFDVVVSEALDRLSRDQEDIAAIYKRMQFAGVAILTLSEGEITQLHIGLKGTMNALFLKDLADKTRRGLRGRIEAGRSGGGDCYGYDIMRRPNSDERGERAINETEAAIVRRIFKEFAAGRSSKSIAADLNAEGVPGPRGGEWGFSTISGNRRRGTGVLNQELYIGALIWNRLRYLKHPITGKRNSKPNPESEWIRTEVPEMRIVDEELWQAVKARQKAMEPLSAVARRRPKYLLSGLVKCASCGSGYAMVSQTHMGCSRARNKGTCDNRLTIKREDLEQRILTTLQHRLFDPAMIAEYCEEYARHVNALRMGHNSMIAGLEAEMKHLKRESNRLIDIACKGEGDNTELAVRLGELGARMKEVTRLQERDYAETKPLLHPSMGKRFQQTVGELVRELGDDQHSTAASDLLRSLIDRINLTPRDDGNGLVVDLLGDLAGILAMSSKNTKAPTPSGQEDIEALRDSLNMVAGARYPLCRTPVSALLSLQRAARTKADGVRREQVAGLRP